MNQQQPSLNQKKRLDVCLRLVKLNHAALEVLEYKVNNLMEALIPAVAAGKVPSGEVENLRTIDKEVQELLIFEFQKFALMEEMAANAESDRHADYICTVLRMHNGTIQWQVRSKLTQVESLYHRLKASYHIVA